MGHFWTILGSFWDHFGVILGHFWDHFGVILGPFWGHFGTILGSFWDHFGALKHTCIGRLAYAGKGRLRERTVGWHIDSAQPGCAGTDFFICFRWTLHVVPVLGSSWDYYFGVFSGLKAKLEQAGMVKSCCCCCRCRPPGSPGSKPVWGQHVLPESVPHSMHGWQEPVAGSMTCQPTGTVSRSQLAFPCRLLSSEEEGRSVGIWAAREVLERERWVRNEAPGSAFHRGALQEGGAVAAEGCRTSRHVVVLEACRPESNKVPPVSS